MGSKRINGRYVVAGLIGFTLLFGLVFWWLQQQVFYQETQAGTVEIAGAVYPVDGWKGITASSTPLHMRACFVLDAPVEALPALAPKPLEAPGWFRCFNARVIAESLESGYAKAFVAARDDPPGFDRIIAVFPGGRSYMWRQLNEPVTQ